MVGWHRFGIGFLGAMAIHVIATSALVGFRFFCPPGTDIVPEFQMGISALEMAAEPVVPLGVLPQPASPSPAPVVEPALPPMPDAAPVEETSSSVPVTMPVDTAPRGVLAADAVPYGVVRPVYPRGARQRGEEGRVVVEVKLTSDGRARDVTVTSSSGFDSLDRAAAKAAGEASFRSKSGGSTDGQKVPLTFRFTLESAPAAGAQTP